MLISLRYNNRALGVEWQLSDTIFVEISLIFCKFKELK